jgi:1,2-dihydroxy-3-keto-5-methylthiopentene dioxygenase
VAFAFTSCFCFAEREGSACAHNSTTWLQGDQRLPHDSGKDLDAAELERLGVLYFKHPELASVDALAAERGYRNRDEITVSPDKMGPVYEDKVKMFFDEHLHEDEEIRYIRDGQGYFDVRSKDDAWVRIQLQKDDLIILPPGIYHRFTTDESNVSAGGKSVLRGEVGRPGISQELTDDNRDCSISRPCVCSRMSPSGHP